MMGGIAGSVVAAVLFVVAAPFAGMLITGIDRKLTARMQRRVGPPILQPFYDVRKLLAKERRSLNSSIDFFVLMALALAVAAGAIFFAGANLLLSVFVLTASALFSIMAAYSAASPYSEIGAQRENLQAMAYEPLMILMPVAVYLCCGSMDTSSMLALDVSLVCAIPLVFVAYLIVLTIKLRKSPFDLSTSHHAHQEVVKGLTTEMSGRTLAMVEIMEWYETVLFYAMVGMFFVSSAWWSWIVAVAVAALAFLLEILVDNNAPRVKWQALLATAWIATLVLVSVNFAGLAIL